MSAPRGIIFDLDDTLAESFKRPSDEMLARLGKLLERLPVAIMTGSGFNRMESQFLSVIAAYPRAQEHFYLFPNSSAQCYVLERGQWKQQYNFALTEEERTRIKTVIEKIVAESGLLRDIPHAGQRLFDREAQVAFTPVGVDAPLETKQLWDPGGGKRKFLFDALSQALPEFEVLLGGTTTIDVTRKGINKSYGVQWLSERLNIPTNEMLYVGDAFNEGGNDRVVMQTGILTRPVSGPLETAQVIDEILGDAT